MENDLEKFPRTRLTERLCETEKQPDSSGQQETQRKENDDFLLVAYQDAPTACVKTSPEGVIEAVNEKACELFGCSAQECLGKNFFQMLPDESRAEYQVKVEMLTPEQPVFYAHIHSVSGNRMVRPLVWSSRGIFDSSGCLKYMLSYCLSDDAQESIANHLWTLEQKGKQNFQPHYRLLNVLLKMIQVSNTLDNQNILQLVNEQYEADASWLLRYQADADNFSIEEMCCAESSGLRKMGMGEKVRLKTHYIEHYKRGQGRVGYVGEEHLPNSITAYLESHRIAYQSIVTLPVMAYETLWGVLVILRETNLQRWLEKDITQAELFAHAIGVNLERIATQRELERQQTISRLAMEKSEVYSWQYNVKEDVYHHNELMLKRYGFPLGEQPVFNAQMFFELVHPDDLSIVLPVFAEALKGMEGDVQLRIRVRKPEGDVYEWFEYRFMALRDKTTGQVVEVIGTGTCIEKFKLAEQRLMKLLEAKNQAEESNRLKTAFIANMSHEIRTPLNAILGFSEILMEAEDREEREEYMRIIRNNSDLLLKLINDILDMSRIEAGRTELLYAFENIEALFDGLAQSARMVAQEKGLWVKLEKGLPECGMEIDRSRVTQIIMNFVNNAVKFTKTGGITLGYRLSDDGKGVYYFVRDTGSGIRKEDQARVFQRFVKLNDFAQGSGLGLSICETLVKKMGGQIGVVSHPGKGSEFWFTLPFHRPSQPQTALDEGEQEE